MAGLHLLEEEWGMTTLAHFPISLNYSRLCLTSVMFELMTKTTKSPERVLADRGSTLGCFAAQQVLPWLQAALPWQ